MTDTVNFALRLPPEMKAAAKALTNVSLYKPSTKEGFIDAVHTYSMNEAMISLMRCGLAPMLSYAQSALDEANAEHEPLAELMAFFIANPAIDCARTVNFESGRKARAYIEAYEAETEGSGEDLPEGLDRASVADMYAAIQRRLLSLTAAKGAIQKALAFHGR